MIKTFRGKLTDGQVKKIRLSTKKGKIGYRIVKFQIIAEKPGQDSIEATVTVNKVGPTAGFTPSNEIDLSDNNVLAVGFYAGNAAAFNYPTSQVLIFDQEVFNQDIFIGNNDLQSNAMCYYMEIETIMMTDNAAAVSTLRDIRLNPQKHA